MTAVLRGKTDALNQAAHLIDADLLLAFRRQQCVQVWVGAGGDQPATPAFSAGAMFTSPHFTQDSRQQAAGELVLADSLRTPQQERMG